jgi:hypothetical protein
MSPVFSTFIGVESGSWRRPFTYIALDSGRNLLAVGSGSPVDVLAFAFGQSSALLALSPPLRPYRFHPASPESGLVSVSGYLRHMEPDQIREPGTSRTAPAGLPIWLRGCFALLDRLNEFGYRPFPEADAPRQWLEVQSEAAFHALIGLPPFQAGTLEGRIQRQLLLADQDLDVPDAMDFFEEITRHRLVHGILPTDKVLPQSELNAWMAAQLAWMAANQPEELAPVTGLEEGSIYLPVHPL